MPQFNSHLPCSGSTNQIREEDPRQLQLPLDLEPPELARARFLRRRLFRCLISSFNSLIGSSERAFWLRLAVASLVFGAVIISSISFLNAVDIRPDYSLYLSFLIPSDYTLYGHPETQPQTSTLKVRLVPCAADRCLGVPHSPDDIFIDIRVHAEISQIPLIFVSNVVNNNQCFIGADTTPYLSIPTRRKEGDFKAIANSAGSVMITGAILQSLSKVVITQVGTFNKNLERDIRILCRSTLVPHKDTFTDRRLSVYTENEEWPTLNDGLFRRQRYTVDYSAFAEHEGFRVTGGNPIIGDKEVAESEARSLPSNDWPLQTEVIWRDTKEELVRDVILVVSGSSFGMTGAFLVEVIRPRFRRRVL